MSEKIISQHESFEKMRKDKEDANMRYISECIHDEYYSADIEKVVVPADIDADLIAFCRKKDEEYENRHRKKKAYITLRRCAVFLVCVGIVGGISVSSVDAWKLRFTNLFAFEEDDHTKFSPTDVNKIEEWNNYYYLNPVPDGYELIYCEERENSKQVYYSNDIGTIALFQYDAGTNSTFDNDTTGYEKVNIRNLDAYYFEDKDNMSQIVLWMEGEYLLKLCCEKDGKVSKEDILHMAENLLFYE